MAEALTDGDVYLLLGLKNGRNADAAVAAESLLAWIDLARDAARVIDPFADIRIELLGREKGSLAQWLRIVDDQIATVSAGADQFPYLKKVAIGLAIATATAGIQTFVEESLKPEVQQVSLSTADRDLLESMTTAIRKSDDTARSVKRFYRALERDPAVTNVIIKTGRDEMPLVKVDRSEFAMRGGLYSRNDAEQADETKREVWSVVLMQAPFYASSKRWRFSRDGVPFSAAMHDAIFLQAIVDGTVPISLRTGVRMEVEVEWRQQARGNLWAYVPGTRRVTRVLSPRPAPVASDDPEENDQPDEDRR
jgi:hypothetical protein